MSENSVKPSTKGVLSRFNGDSMGYKTNHADTPFFPFLLGLNLQWRMGDLHHTGGPLVDLTEIELREPLLLYIQFMQHHGWLHQHCVDVLWDMIEGSLQVKLPTIWTDGKAEVGRVREEKRSSERIRAEKEGEERRGRCAKR